MEGQEKCAFFNGKLAMSRKQKITACAIATSCCISDVPSQWEGQNFDPPQLPHFSTDFNETRNQERYLGYDPTSKIWLMWDDGKGVCVGRPFSVTFCVLSFFVFLLTPTGHTRRPITTVYGSKRVFPRKVGPFVGLDDKKQCLGVKTPQKHDFWRPE